MKGNRRMRAFTEQTTARIFSLALLLLTLASSQPASAGEHRVDQWQNIPCVLWTRGCAPTAASMVLGIWDPSDIFSDDVYVGYGKLTEYWHDLSEYTDERTGKVRNVPNVLEPVRGGMKTDGDGNSNTDRVSSGVEAVTNTRHGYDFAFRQTQCDSMWWWWDNDWCWDHDSEDRGIRDEIDAGRPFLWTVIAGDKGHTVAAFGYTDDNYVIVYNTWKCPGEEFWYYSEYDNGSDLDKGYVNVIAPGGGSGGFTDLIYPDGGQVWYPGETYEILWNESEPTTSPTVLKYSVDGGISWSLIASDSRPPAGGFPQTKTYEWTVPVTLKATKTARIRVMGFSGDVKQSGDGSMANFEIGARPDLVVNSVVWSPKSPNVDDTVTVTITVRNRGNAAAARFATSFYKDLDVGPKSGDLPDFSCYENSLDPGATATCKWTVKYHNRGTYDTWVWVDSESTVPEIREWNNFVGPKTLVVEAKAQLSVAPYSNELLVAGPAGGPFIPSAWLYTLTNIGTRSMKWTAAAWAPWVTLAPASGDLAGGAQVLVTASLDSAALSLAAGSYTATLNFQNLNGGLGNTKRTVRLQAGPDLVETSCSASTSTVDLGGSFTVADTLNNLGAGAAAASVTRYYLSADGVARNTLLSGQRSIAPLSAGAGSVGSALVSVPAGAKAGAWFVLACADDTKLVPEVSEAFNCTASEAKVSVKAPDLVDKVITSPLGDVVVGSTVTISDNVLNQGDATAAASTTAYYLSNDTALGSGDKRIAKRAAGALSPNGNSSGGGPVTVPSSAAPGTYYILACADVEKNVAEGNEANNCAASAKSFQVTAPDLIETAVTDPPSVIVRGATFAVSDTAHNQGSATATAGPSSSRYYLSTDDKVGDDLLLSHPGRAVPQLAPSAASSGTVIVGVPLTIPPGEYYLLACADRPAAVTESDEGNNCKASATKGQVEASGEGPDLVVTRVGDPPSEIGRGASFTAQDTTRNQGTVTAGRSSTRYYLSSVPTPGDDLPLAGQHFVAALSAETGSTASVNVTVPVSAALGSYYLVACADNGNAVAEYNEANNCRAATEKVQVKAAALPDLVMTSISGPSGAAPGGSFTVTDTITNQGDPTAAPSVTGYFLVGEDDNQPLSGSRSVGTLAGGASSSGTTTVTISKSIPPASYELVGCADYTGLVSEVDEANNCVQTGVSFYVGAPKPDLVVATLSEPPATIRRAQPFPVTDTTRNQGDGAAGGSYTAYYLSVDAKRDGVDDYALSPGRLVPALAAGANSSASVPGVTVGPSVPLGTYYLLACADNFKKVPESSETNNCRVSAGKVEVLESDLPDLFVTSVSTAVPVVTPGTAFRVSDTVINQGAGSAGASVTRYFLWSTDESATEYPLTGERTVAPLSPGAYSAATVTVTVPGVIQAGEYTLGACTDYTAAVAESNEGNNCTAGTVLDVQ